MQKQDGQSREDLRNAPWHQSQHVREARPEQYGTITLEQINDALRALARELGVTVVNFQSNIPVLEWIAICLDCVPSSRRRMPEIHSK
jgi:3-dehydroquinate dehydratase